MRFSTMTAGILRQAFTLPMLVLLFFSATVNAQPDLDFKRIQAAYGDIALYFTVHCNGIPERNFLPGNFVVTENGTIVDNLYLWCPDPNVAPAISVSLVFDASASIFGANLAGAKAGGHAFIDLMDGVIDEASVLQSTTVVSVLQQMTTNKPMLHSAMDALSDLNDGAIWDGAYTGLIELINNGVNQVRAVIVLADGADYWSTRKPSEIIALANRHRIAMYMIGVRSPAVGVEMQNIADASGGAYFHAASPDSVASIYRQVHERMMLKAGECVISYDNACKDGSLRTVELQVSNVCGGSASKVKSYRAALDSATFSETQIEFGDASVQGGKDFSIPMQLLTPLNKVMFNAFSFKLIYDTSCMQLRDVTAPENSLLKWIPISVTPEAGGARILVMDKRMIDGSGMLLQCEFTAVNPANIVNCVVNAEEFAFESGCLLPIVSSGDVVVHPHVPGPEVVCDMDAPRTLRWDRAAGNYSPNPILVELRSYNTGDVAALNSHARISFDTTVFTLSSPQVMEQPGSPRDILPNGFNSVIWQLHAKPRIAPDSGRICIEMTYDNHRSQSCCVQVYVPPQDASLSCAVSIPPIVLDTLTGDLAPMPFDVTVTGWNDSTMPTDTVRATISFAPELQFAAPDSPARATKLLSNPLLPAGQHGTATWRLRHQPSVTDLSYVVTVKLHSRTDSTECSAMVRIPRQPEAFFTFDLTADGPIEFCDGGSVTLDAGAGYTSYLWNTGSVSRRITVTETGDFRCRVTDTTGLTGFSKVLRVNEYPFPSISIIPAGPSPLCENDTMRLVVSNEYDRYLWSTGSTEHQIVVTQSGDYHVTVWGPGDCPGKDTVTLKFNPMPLKPVIVRSQDSLIVSEAGGSIRWYRDGRWVLSTFTNVLLLTQPGTYVATRTGSGGCVIDSDPFVVTVLDVDAAPSAANFRILAYPDPADDVLNIELRDTAGEHVRIAVTDVLGRSETVYSGRAGEAGVALRISLQGRARGPLFIQVWQGNTMSVKKVMRR